MGIALCYVITNFHNCVTFFSISFWVILIAHMPISERVGIFRQYFMFPHTQVMVNKPINNFSIPLYTSLLLLCHINKAKAAQSTTTKTAFISIHPHWSHLDFLWLKIIDKVKKKMLRNWWIYDDDEMNWYLVLFLNISNTY